MIQVPDLLRPVEQKEPEVTTPPSKVTALSQAAGRFGRDAGQDFVHSMETVASINPDAYAKATTVSRLSGIAPKVLHDHRDRMEQLLRGNEYAGIYERFSKTANALRDGNMAAISQDDLDQLTRIEGAASDGRFNEQGTGEKLFGAIRQQWIAMRQSGRVSMTLDHVSELERFDAIDVAEASGEIPLGTREQREQAGVYGLQYLSATPEQRAQLREFITRGQADLLSSAAADEKTLAGLPVDPGARRAAELEAGGQGSLAATAEALMENPGYALRTSVGAAATSAPMLVAGAIGGPLPAAIIGYGMEYDAKLVDVLREAGVDFNDPKAVMRALQDDALIADGQRRASLKAAGTTVVDMVSMSLASRLLAPSQIGGRTLSNTQRELANLAVQFPVQGITEGAGEAAGQFLAEGEVDAGEVLLEAVAGAGMSSVDVLAFSSSRFIEYLGDGLRSARESRAGADALGEMVDASLNSKTRKRDRETFRALAEQQLQDSPMETIWLPAEALQRLNQSSQVNLPELLTEVPGLAEQFADAAARGGSVSMKTSDYLALFADYHDQLAGSVRINVDGMSTEDAEAWNSEVETQLDALAEQMRMPPDSAAEMRTQLVGELVASGYRRADAEQYAATHLSVMQNLAERTGVALEQLRDQYQLEVGAKAPEQLRAVSVDDARIAIQRLRAGDIPRPADMFGQTLREYVISTGGLNDEGGELAALDADVGRVGRSRVVRPAGRSLDEVAMDAWERGYFPGVAREGVSAQLIVDGIQSELAGSPVYSTEQENATLREQADTLNQLQEYMDRLGVDIAEMSDDEVLALLQGQGGQMEGQRLDQFAGPGALTANQQALAEAQQRIAAGDDAEQVRQGTGWFKGADGKWRFEIADGDAKIMPALEAMKAGRFGGDQISSVIYRNAGGIWTAEVATETMETPSQIVKLTVTEPDTLRPVLGNSIVDRMLAMDGEPNPLADEEDGSMYMQGDGGVLRANRWATVGDVLDHPRLYEAYPELAGVRVVYAPEKLGPRVAGAVSIDLRNGEPVIILGDADAREVRKTLLHELQHVVQRIEGFALGGNADTIETDQAARDQIASENEAFRIAQWAEQYPEAAAAQAEIDRLRGELEARYGDAFSEEAMESELFAQYDQAMENAMLNVAGFEEKPLAGIDDLMPSEVYHRLAGEIEARTVEARSHMTEAIARLIPPSRSADVSDANAIVTWGGTEMRSEQVEQAVRLNQTGLYVDSFDQIAGLDDELQQMASELLDSGAQITADGRVRLYHRTSAINAEQIRETGSMSGAEDGLFFSTKRDGGQASEFGDAVLSFTIPLEELQVDDTFGSEAHVRVPLEFAGEVLDVSKWLSEERGTTLFQSQPNQQTETAAFTAPQEAETGTPMLVYFARNTSSSKGNAPAGMDFGQKIEPAGEYMVIQDSDMSEQGGDGWQYGTVTFRNPLVLEHKSTNSTGWKKDLSEMFGGKTGKALANAVKKAGHDGIVTRDKYGYSETVNLGGAKQQTLEQSGDDDARGFITFQPRQQAGEQRRFQITLGEKRDLSTLLHELGHYYLEVLDDIAAGENPPEQVVRDVAAIRKWIGAEDGQPITTEQHEQFARGFEAYLAEGNAPNPELAGAFARFKRWIIGVYKDLARLNVDLTDEVRGVFDRLVATDEQIVAAEQVSNAIPLFADAQAAGMTDAEFAAYQDSLAIAHADAQESVEREVQREEDLRRSKWWREETARVRAEVVEEIDTVQVYAAMRALRTGNMPDGTTLPIKLNSAELTERYGASTARRLAFTYSKTGQSMEVVAPMLGYESGDQMIKDMLGAVPRSQLIEQETQQRMLERHGPKTTGEAAERALDAVHNERRADVLNKELRALGKQGNRNNITSQQILKEAARRIMAERKVRDIQPSEYQRAEAKAGRQAFEAMTRGNVEAAYEAKQRQLMNFYLYREARKARENVDSIVTRLNKYNRRSKREQLGKAGESYLDQIDTVMEQYEFRTVSLREIDQRVSFAQWYADQLARGNEPYVPEFVLNNSKRTNYKELSLAQLQELDEFVANVNHLAKTKNRLLANQRIREFDQARTELIRAGYSNLEKRKAPPIDKNTRTMLQKIGDGASEFSAALIKMEQVIDWLDDGQVDGPWSTVFWQPFVEAQSEKERLNREFAIKMTGLVDAYTKERGAKVMRQQTYIAGLGESLSHNAILSAALNTGNAGNRKKLLDGGHNGKAWSEQQLNEIVGNLNAADWAFVQSMWDLVEELWPNIEQLEKDLHGIPPAKVEATPVVTQHGEFRGGYWPLVYDTSSSAYAGVQNQLGNEGGLFEQGYARATTPKGHTKARVDSFAAPILLDVEIVASHLGQVIHDLTHRKAIRDGAKIIGDKQIKQMLIDTLGANVANQFNPWLQGVANDMVLDSQKGIDAWTRGAEQLRANLAVGWMGFSATTGIQQILGYSQTFEFFSKIGARRYVFQGMQQFIRRPWETVEFVNGLSSEMRYRVDNLDRDMRSVLKRIGGKNDGLSIVQRLAFKHIGVIQGMVDYPTWLAGYHHGLDTGLTAEDAVAAGDRAVRLTQMAAGPKDLAAIQRKDGLMRTLTIVYSYFNLLYNRQVDIAKSIRTAKGLQDYLNAFERTMFLIAIPAIAGPLITGQGPGEDEDWRAWASLKIATYPLLGIPLLRDLASSIESGWGYKGATPIGDLFATLSKLAAVTGKAVEGEEVELERVTLLGIEAVGYGFGLPVAQPKRTARYLFAVEDGEIEPEGVTDWMRGLIFGPPKE